MFCGSKLAQLCSFGIWAKFNQHFLMLAWHLNFGPLFAPNVTFALSLPNSWHYERYSMVVCGPSFMFHVFSVRSTIRSCSWVPPTCPWETWPSLRSAIWWPETQSSSCGSSFCVPTCVPCQCRSESCMNTSVSTLIVSVLYHPILTDTLNKNIMTIELYSSICWNLYSISIILIKLRA